LIAIVLIVWGAFIVGRQSNEGKGQPVVTSMPTAIVASTPPQVPPSAAAQSPVGAPMKPPAPKRTSQYYYNHVRRNMMRQHWDQPAHIRKTLGDWAGANELCLRGADVATLQKWCPIRNALDVKLSALGMCYGRPTDRSAPEGNWRTCTLRDGPW
jgi:hypothetical protein